MALHDKHSGVRMGLMNANPSLAIAAVQIVHRGPVRDCCGPQKRHPVRICLTMHTTLGLRSQ